MRILLSLLVVAAAGACGDDGVNRLPDAPPLPPDGAPEEGPVTLTITRGSEPIADVVVLFQNADSSLVSRTTTNAQGVASARMAAGGFVTAIEPFPQPVPVFGTSGDDLHTFAGVKPGDELVLHEDDGNAPIITVNFVIPTLPTASSYMLWTTCGSRDISGGGGSGSGSGAPGGPVELVGCGAMIDIIIGARDIDGQLTSALVRKNVAVVDGMTLDLLDGAYVAIPQVAFTYANLPDGITVLNVFDQLFTANGPLFDGYTAADVTAGAASPTIARPEVAGATSLTATTFYNGSMGRHEVVDWGPAGAYTFDGRDVLLREYGSIPAFDAATQSFSWESSSGVAPDLGIVTAYIERQEGKGFTGWRWEIVAPYAGAGTSARIAFPTLPSSDSDYNARPSDQVNLDDLITIKAPGGYDAVRETALTSNPYPPFVGTTGRIVMETFERNVEARRAPGRAPVQRASVRFRPAKLRARAR